MPSPSISAMSELSIIYDHLRYKLVRRTRPLTIHTEALHKERVWSAVQKWVEAGNKAVWFVVAPMNWDFVSAEMGVSLSRKEYESVLLERYRWLQQHGQEIQAQIHLRILPQMYESEAEEKKDLEEKVAGSIKWLKANGFPVTKIVFGWWSFNQQAAAFAQQLGVDPVRRRDYYFIHDYDFVRE